MAYKKRTWAQKLTDSKDFPKVCPIDQTRNKRWGTGTNGIKISRKSAPQLHLLHLRKMWPPVRMVVAEATNQQEATDG